MSFRVYAAGLLTLIAYQIAVAMAVAFFMVHCEPGRTAPEPDEAATMTLPGPALGPVR